MAKPIMIQGTMSNAGKSLFAGGLCRIFMQDGYRVAPFKSQNMALNSYITSEGLEMGRAQVMQAEAAGIAPDVKMNPILLKPTNDIGSQVIVNGVPIGNMSAKEYYTNKKNLIPHIMSAYNALSAENDIIVIEGAGSPAEINLKQNDIVNMGMAELVKAPVLLVGDIDRGGVFAQLYGTVALLEKAEQRYIKGLIINKFRGDRSILESGLEQLKALIGKDVLGVVPYIYCDIDDEDSLSQRFDRRKTTGLVDIAVIRLPRISNFTDFNRFETIEDVNLRYVSDIHTLGEPDMIILPGTKNTVSDLMWLRSNGLEARIKQLSANGKIIFGICGGYQMMGEEISDPQNIEGGGTISGMGLLPVKTIFNTEKQRTLVNGVFGTLSGALAKLSGQSFSGYEIHNGITSVENPLCTITTQSGEVRADGICVGNAYGSYIHGIFDSENVVETVINTLFAIKGIDKSIVMPDLNQYKQTQYDLLADAIRNSVDMPRIYDILWEGIK